MAEVDCIPVFKNGRFYAPGLVGQPLPKGQLIGSVVYDPDALTFESYNYNCRPWKIGQAKSLIAAMHFFQTRRAPPRPPSAKFDRFIVHRR
jgi:hypothetical protein